MSIDVEISNMNAKGRAVASAGTPDARTLGGSRVTPGSLTTATGRIVLDADNETLKFVPDDEGDFAAVVDADS